MPYALVPTEVTESGVVLWVAAANEAPAADLSLKVNSRPVNLGPWERWQTSDASKGIHYQRVHVSPLASGSVHFSEILSKGKGVSSARFRTLPSALPTLLEPPLTVFLGSCFCAAQDKAQMVAWTYSNVFRDNPPDVKVLCGDQVYLDSPWYNFSFRVHGAGDLEKTLFSRYFETWFRQGGGVHFQDLLQTGANYFTCDDHEYWNNAPDLATFVLNTFTESGRQCWHGIASSLFRTFQTQKTIQKFNVGKLHFLIADTRTNRAGKRQRFISDEDLDAIGHWATTDLKAGPGIFVLGQPIFTTTTNSVQGFLADWSLPDFSQFWRLAHILQTAASSVAVLTGDVHFARVARTRILNANINLIELISSPMSFVTGESGDWKPAPGRFPVKLPDQKDCGGPCPPFIQTDVVTPGPFEQLKKAHFMTVEFRDDGSRILMKPVLWPIASNTNLPLARLELPVQELDYQVKP